MPPSAPLPIHQQPQISERDAVGSPSTPSHEYSDDKDNILNDSKMFTASHQRKNGETAIPANPSPTTTFVQPPIDPGFNNMWNTNSMVGMNPYNNSYNPMNPSNSMYGNYGGFGGNSMMMMPPTLPMFGGGGAGPFSTITNYLLGIQNVIMSIGQVVQIVSFNASSLQQLCESVLAMFEHAIRSWHEQQQQNRLLKRDNTGGIWNDNNDVRTPEEIQKALQQRRRLRALRYTVTIAISYAIYSIIRKVLFQQQRHNRHLEQSPLYNHQNEMSATPSMYHANSNNTGLHPPTRHYSNYHQHGNMSNPYWNSVPPPPPYQQPPPPYYHY